MKKIFLIATLGLCIFQFSNAQGFKVGVKVGANLSNLTGTSFKDGFDFGYHAGLFSELMITEKFGIQPELLFSETNLRTGASFNSLYSTIALSDITKIKLQYMMIPVLLDFKPISLVTLQVGPQFGILMNQTKSLQDNAGEAFKKGDFSMLGGVQLNFLKFRVYGRYAVGLMNMNDIDSKDKWKSETLQIGAGITL
jgi:hypothetical protein